MVLPPVRSEGWHSRPHPRFALGPAIEQCYQMVKTVTLRQHLSVDVVGGESITCDVKYFAELAVTYEGLKRIRKTSTNHFKL
jgi:hypothetical protein